MAIGTGKDEKVTNTLLLTMEKNNRWSRRQVAVRPLIVIAVDKCILLRLVLSLFAIPMAIYAAILF